MPGLLCNPLYHHLFICIIYGGWPSSITWWVVNITSLAVTALLGEYLCMRRELREFLSQDIDQVCLAFHERGCAELHFSYMSLEY
ncbi:UNVERIFIED_CONTAM: protein SYS1 [Sesamum radiatum]|uniref:Protein SYS1 n=1 Tax=Sesamum radiatum TaxID=300843 RepID=A0AAW2WJF9_SESRA